MAKRDAFLEEHFGNCNCVRMGELVTASKLNKMIRFDPLEYVESISNKHRCCYCGGDTTDDRRGNCAACGAPRIKTDKIEVIHSSEKEWTFGNDSVLGINTTLL
jgi:ribosomal protein L37E